MEELVAKPTKNAPKICVAVIAFMVLGLLVGLLTDQPLWAILGLLPVTIYEVYRTEGASTSWASWVLLAALVLLGVLLVFGIDLDLADLLGRSSETVAGYEVPLGPITMVAPLLMAVLCLILIVRTRGRYTRILAVSILVGAGGLIFILDPTVLGTLVDAVLEVGLPQLR
jgi:hypothetical protein